MDACHAFADALHPHLASLQYLDLSRNQLNSREFQALQLHRLESLQTLELWDNKLDDGTALREVLRHCACLKELNLRSNELGSEGVIQAFSMSGEEQSHPLEKLILSSNLVSDAGAQHLAQLIQQGGTFSNLKYLVLGCNDIGSDGAVALASALEHTTTTLQVLDLCRNKIGNVGGMALAKAHRGNTNNLHELNLSNNRITHTTILKDVRFYGKLNAAGRRLLQMHNAVPTGLWPLVLEKMNWQLTVRHYFVRRLPELFAHRQGGSSE